MTLLIVVAKFSENLDWLHEIPSSASHHIVIYDKSPGGTHRNVGREAETFARCICERYETLHEFSHVAFLQGNPFDHIEKHALFHMLMTSSARDDVVPLGQVLCSDELGCPHHPGLPVGARWTELDDDLDVSADHVPRASWPFAAGAQYLVPTRSILRRPKEFWERLHALVLDGRICPWTVERFWLLIFSRKSISV